MKDSRTYWQIDDLKAWDKNPRVITKEAFLMAKKQMLSALKKYPDLKGQIRPMVVNSGKYWGEKGQTIGGNMRLRVFREVGIKDIYVEVLDPKNEQDFIDMAMRDNSRWGKDDADMFANMVGNFKNIEWNEFRADFKDPVNLSDFFVLDENKVEGEVPFTEELLEEHNYVVLYFDNEIDWLQLQTLYPLPTVQSLDSTPDFKKSGVGRVVKGTDFINRIREQK